MALEVAVIEAPRKNQAAQEEENPFAWQKSWQSASMFQVRGVSFREEAATQVQLGDMVMLVREMGNPTDARAVSVWRMAAPAVKVGYVPRELTHAFQEGAYLARVMAVGIHPVSMNVGLRLAVPDPTPYKRDVHVEFSEAVTVRSHL